MLIHPPQARIPWSAWQTSLCLMFVCGDAAPGSDLWYEHSSIRTKFQ